MRATRQHPASASIAEGRFAGRCSAAVRLAAQRLRRRRVRRTATLGVLAGGGLASAAVGAVVLLGAPAPDSVKRDLRAVDHGMPADLRRNPDVEGARAVAIAGNRIAFVGGSADALKLCDARTRVIDLAGWPLFDIVNGF